MFANLWVTYWRCLPLWTGIRELGGGGGVVPEIVGHLLALPSMMTLKSEGYLRSTHLWNCLHGLSLGVESFLPEVGVGVLQRGSGSSCKLPNLNVKVLHDLKSPTLAHYLGSTSYNEACRISSSNTSRDWFEEDYLLD